MFHYTNGGRLQYTIIINMNQRSLLNFPSKISLKIWTQRLSRPVKLVLVSNGLQQ